MSVFPSLRPSSSGRCRRRDESDHVLHVLKRAHDRAVDGNLLAVVENDLAGDPEGRIAADLGLRVQYRLGAARSGRSD
jgi:hypothetical protein